MRIPTLRAWLPLLTVAVMLAWAGPAAAGEKEDGFTKLFNGKDLTGWKIHLDPRIKFIKDPMTFTVKEGAIVATGNPNGFIYTDKSYKNYVLRYDWQYARPKDLTDDMKFKGNSGCLVHIHEPTSGVVGGVWPQCVEVQGMNLNHGQLLFLKAKGKGEFDKKAKDKAVKAVGEWNTTEITCRGDGSIAVKINGTDVSSGTSDLTEGQIGFQSEGAEIHFRNIRLLELPPGLTTKEQTAPEGE